MRRSFSTELREALMPNGQKSILATTAGTPLAQEICTRLSIEPTSVHLGRFNDSEIDVQILHNVRGSDVFIIAPTHPPAENLFEAVLLAEAARLSSAGRITMIVPYLGYARSDRKDKPRKAIGVRVALQMLEIPKPDRFIFLDIHAEQSLACIKRAVPDHLYGSAIAIPHMQSLLTEVGDFVIASPDAGGVARALKYAHLLGQEDVVIFSKQRPSPGKIKKGPTKIIGDVKKKTVILVDDMIDTGGSIIADATTALDQGARRVWVFGTHGLLSGDAISRIEKSPIDRVFITDSIWHDRKKIANLSRKIEILSCAGLFAKAIDRTHAGLSLSELIL